LLNYLLWILVGVLYFAVFKHLYLVRWEMLDYTHAYFILPASLFIIWLQRLQLREIAAQVPANSLSVQSNYLSLLSMILGLCLFVFGWRHDYIFISTFSLIPLLAGITGYLWGPAMLKAVTFPLSYLLFLIPPPAGILDAITIPMRKMASIGAVLVLKSFHLPVDRQGLLIYINNHEIYMAPACSGFRSLITFMALSLLYLYFLKTSTEKKWVLLLSVIPLSLLGNLVRVILLCLITYTFGDEIGQGFLHEFSGILVFAVIIGGFMIIDKCYDDPGEE
jgi:exosortase